MSHYPFPFAAGKVPGGPPLCGRQGPAAGVALVITLSVVVLLTIVVVSFATTMQLERASSRSSFEQKRAQSFSMLAVDEVIVKLRDNIPTNSQWAVGPGKLYATTTPTGTTPVTIDLSSGVTANPPAGTAVALNRPSLSAPTSFPVVPQNSDYPTPDPMLVNWINVLQDGTRSTDAGYGTSLNLSTNPIVGRYAYWTDAENGKVNLNTAGYAATGAVQLSNDTQLYFSQPNRVDLSMLDPGMSNSSPLSMANSLDTFVFNSGAQASGSRYNPPYNPAAVANATTSARRYSEIEEWARTPGAANPSATSGITAAQVLANRFNLTTQGRAPELTPWGLNRVWWSNYPPGNPVTASGNQTNSPAYVPPTDLSKPTVSAPDARYGIAYPDTRYYVYPWVAHAWNAYSTAAQTTTTLPATHPFQNFSSFSGGQYQGSQNDASFYAFFTSLYRQMERNDWPGMPAVSFVQKYGQTACENIVMNIMCLADATIGSPDGLNQKCMNFDRFVLNGGSAVTYPLNRDTRGCYGLYVWKSPIANSTHYMMGKGNWPYVDKVLLDFSGTTAGQTKSAVQPGFCNPIAGTDKTSLNIKMAPRLELVWPPGVSLHNVSGRTYANRFSSPAGGDAGILCELTQISVVAKGVYKGLPVTYDGSGQDPSSYAWRYTDDVTGSQALGWSLSSAAFTPPTLNTPSYNTNPLIGNKYFTVGPFDIDSQPTVTASFRVATSTPGATANAIPLQVIPLTPAAPSGPEPGQIFTFTYKFDDLSASALPVTEAYECIDPRVYGNVAKDWKNIGTILSSDIGKQNAIYTSSNPGDSTMDDSKFAFPVEDLVVDQGAGETLFPILGSSVASSPNRYQTATSVTGMAGMGWLSLISTADDEGSLVVAPDVPLNKECWKTLKFEPTSDTTTLPDWLMMDLFAVAYDQSYCSQTSGMINLNSRINPFSFDRTRPLQALIGKATSNGASVTAATASSLAMNIAERQFSGNTYTTAPPIYLYAGEICQVKGVADNTSINQYSREALVRDIAGLVTTQSSDFSVHIVAQSVKQTANTGKPATDLKLLSEYRGCAVIERTPDLGPDGIPGTADDFYGADGVKSNDDIKLVKAAGGTTSSLAYSVTTDPMLVGGASSPPFHYRLSRFKPLTE